MLMKAIDEKTIAASRCVLLTANPEDVPEVGFTKVVNKTQINRGSQKREIVPFNSAQRERKNNQRMLYMEMI